MSDLKLGVILASTPTDEFYAKRAATMVDTLLWWARVAKDGRENHPVPGR